MKSIPEIIKRLEANSQACTWASNGDLKKRSKKIEREYWRGQAYAFNQAAEWLKEE